MLQAPKGTKDVLPPETAKWQHIERVMREVSGLYGYQEARTPVFEHTELFLRGVGDTTDIVQKEMYTFEDKAGRSVTLKPEGTAGVVRALIEHKLFAGVLPIKLYYVNNPNFRYEKPQSGRLREFHQFGVECFGAKSASVDAEVIQLAMEVLKKLGITALRASINSIGCPNCRPAYQQKLRDFLAEKLPLLCEDCKGRYERNPLRILDCKNPKCQAHLVDAPKPLDNLCEECAEHFADLQQHLSAADVPYAIDTGIVRGLDYYTKTVFEIIADIGGGLTMCGGGRYDGLVSELGGPEMPGIGFGMGQERLLMVLEDQGIDLDIRPPLDVFLCCLPDGREAAGAVLSSLRAQGIRADMDHMGKSLKAQFKYADRTNAPKVLVIGGDELARGTMRLRDMETGDETEVKMEGFAL